MNLMLILVIVLSLSVLGACTTVPAKVEHSRTLDDSFFHQVGRFER
ncbi:hypothetical protein WDW37_07290 [Bdellovibrionota bacterium FG-1]